VLTAASARQGLRIAAACAVAAVIVDYHIPEMNGHEVATEIKRLKPQIPIIMVSSDDAIPEPALNVVDAFVSKERSIPPLVAGDHSKLRRKSIRVPRNQNHGLSLAVLEGSSDEETPYLLDGRKLRHSTVANPRRRDHLWATASRDSFA
jgi:CheY-like chemotaxis protein